MSIRHSFGIVVEKAVENGKFYNEKPRPRPIHKGIVMRINADDWVDLYGNTLFRFAVARVGDHEIAEDLVQETFLAAVKSMERFKGQSSEKTWLFSIMKHKIVDHLRMKKLKTSGREVSFDSDSVEEFFAENGNWRVRPEHWSENPGRVHENKEFVDHFYKCLADLPERNADAFVYREIDGLSTKEICEILGVSKNNCWVILYRARMLLRQCLEIAGFGGSENGGK